MATVPNYYYNSPWIADVGRNLASALKPPDPQELLARERSRWEFSRAQQQAGIADQDRERTLAAEDKLSELLMMEPAVNPVTGQIDENQTELNARRLLGEVVDLGGLRFVDPAMKSAGTASPAFAAQEAMKTLGIQAQQQMMAQRFAQQLGLQSNLFGQQQLLQGNTFAHQDTMQGRLFEQQWRLQLARQEARLAELAAKGPAGAGKAPVVSGKLLEDIVGGLTTMVQQSGKQMRQEDFDRLVDLAGVYTQQSRSAPAGVNRAWSEVFPGVTSYAGAPSADVPEPNTWINRMMRVFGGNPTDSYLAPSFGGGAAAPSSLGDVVTPPQAPTAAPVPVAPPVAPPAPAPAAPSLPTVNADQSTPPVSALKEGVPRKFKSNGQVWELQNGRPVRRRDLEGK
jgi:hypothetical protein